MRNILLISAFIVITAVPVRSDVERGALPVVNYSSAGDYRADRDAWSTVRSRSGLMYFANSEGVLQYNGVTWKLIRLPNRTSVQSLSIDRDGRIIVGSDSEIGVLTETGDGPRYTSFMRFVPDSLRNFAQTWTSDTLNGYTYLQSTSAIFAVHGDSLTVIPASVVFGMLYRFGDRLLVQEQDRGLMELKGTELIPFDSSTFCGTVSIASIFPAQNGKHFVFTKYKGVFLYDGRTMVPFPSPLNDLVLKNRPYRGTVVSTGENALGVVGLGVIIFDSAGTIRSVVSKENGMRFNTVTSVYDDDTGNLWFTGYEGLARVRYPAPLTSFTDRQGIAGAVKMTVRHQGRIYSGTVENLYQLTTRPSVTSLVSAGTRSVFTRIPDVREDCSFMLSVDDDLLVSTTQGVFVVNGTKSRLVTRTYALPLLRSSADPDRVFIGTFGLGSMLRKNGRWTDEGLYDGISEDVYQLLEAAPDRLWLRTYNQGILRVRLQGGASRSTTVERFGMADGLPSLSFLPASIIEGRFCVPTENGIYTFNEQRRRFEPDSLFLRQFPGAPDGIYAIDPGSNGSYWMFVDQPGGYRLTHWLRQADGTFRQQPLPFALPPASRIEWVYEDPDGSCWISGTGGLFRYEPAGSAELPVPFRTAVDRVRLLGNDSIVTASSSGTIKLRYHENSLRFMVSANSFLDEQQTMYQFLLEGFDERWSGWTFENRKEYTNLDPGVYTFRVRAKDALDRYGDEGKIIMEIMPPWWGTWWFRTIVLLFFLTAGPVIYYRRVTALKRQNQMQEEFSRQLINRQEAERKRIAHELHDSISQSLLTIKNRAGMAVERPDEQQMMVEQMKVILTSSSGAIHEIKQITHNLRPYLLDRIGLTKALQALLRTFSESASAKIIGAVDEIDGKLPQENEIHLYRIVQEALNNIQKHSAAAEAHVTIELGEQQLLVTVQDDGKGFDATGIRSDHASLGGLGLDGIAERVKILGGEFRITSRVGQGTMLTITIPLKGTA